MKKLCTLIITLLISFANGMAQFNFTVKAPAITKFAIVNTDGVNLRRTPNATGQKLIGEYIRGGGLEFLWGAANAKGEEGYTEVVHPEKGEALQLIKVVGDWIQVKYWSKLAYIKKEFCTIKTIDDLVEINEDSLIANNIYCRKEGKYAGTYFLINDEYPINRYNGYVHGDIHVGKNVGKFIVFNHYTLFTCCYDNRQNIVRNPYRCPKTGDEDFDKAFALTLASTKMAFYYRDNWCKNAGEDKDLDYTKFLVDSNDETINNYFDELEKEEYSYDVYFMIDGSNRLQRLRIFLPTMKR